MGQNVHYVKRGINDSFITGIVMMYAAGTGRCWVIAHNTNGDFEAIYSNNATGMAGQEGKSGAEKKGKERESLCRY